jgi:hypothetical protein
MAARRRTTTPLDVDAVADRAAGQVRVQTGCAISKLGLPKAIRAEVLARLADRGFEISKSSVRTPVAEQLRAALATGAYLSLKSLKAYVVAATVAEAKAAALELARAGEAHIVLRAGAPAMVPAHTAVLDAQELEALVRGLEQAIMLAKKAAKAKTKLLRDDVDPLLAPFARSVGPTAFRPAAGRAEAQRPHQGEPGTELARLVNRVAAAVAALVDPRLGLAFVPDLVRGLARASDVSVALAAVREAAQQGLIELRPESGLGRLSEDEQALCVSGPDGTWLSWARLAQEHRS